MNSDQKQILLRIIGEKYGAVYTNQFQDFIIGAQTILENPSEWGLVYLKDLDRTLPRIAEMNLEMYKEIEGLKSQLAKYREALERIIKTLDTDNSSPFTSPVEWDVRDIAKEALKQEVNND